MNGSDDERRGLGRRTGEDRTEIARPGTRHGRDARTDAGTNLAEPATRDPDSPDRTVAEVSAPGGGRIAGHGGRPVRLLLVEDDRLLAEALARSLELSGFVVYATAFGEDALDLADAYRFDLILLDLTLPDMPGRQVLQDLREIHRGIPVIILSGDADVGTKVEQLSGGADDYITKPFHPEELIARITALLRRAQEAAPTAIEVGPLTLDLVTHRALVEGEVVPLTGKEYACLEFLARKRGMTVTKEMFLRHLYAGRQEPEMKIIDVFICKIRRKLRESGAPRVIETVWGRGYMIAGE